MVSSNQLVQRVILKNFPQFKDHQVIGPLVWCRDCEMDYFCLRHGMHYADCSCRPFLSGEDEEDDSEGV